MLGSEGIQRMGAVPEEVVQLVPIQAHQSGEASEKVLITKAVARRVAVRMCAATEEAQEGLE
jgi:hypothetical protein